MQLLQIEKNYNHHSRTDLFSNDENYVISLLSERHTNKFEEESLHSWVKVDQAARPLPPKQLSILEA